MKSKAVGSSLLVFIVCVMVGGSGAEAQSTPPTSETPPQPEAIKFIAATPEQKKSCPLNMVYVPAGDFMMGCAKADEECEEMGNDKPYRKVYLDEFQIDKYETTNEEYAKCVSAGKCEQNEKWEGFIEAKQPVVGVNWINASAYCAWAGKRLPTEAEWEKAARGTDGRTYPWGEGINCSKANYKDCKLSKTKPVGSYPSGVSPYGALDMAGNVSEWAADFYEKKYYENAPNRNPKGPSSAPMDYHVNRGGDLYHVDFALYTSTRANALPLSKFTDLGFRCAKSP